MDGLDGKVAQTAGEGAGGETACVAGPAEAGTWAMGFALCDKPGRRHVARLGERARYVQADVVLDSDVAAVTAGVPEVPSWHAPREWRSEAAPTRRFEWPGGAD